MQKRIVQVVIILLFSAGVYQIYKHYRSIKRAEERAAWIASLVHTASPNVEILKDTVMVDYLGKKRTLSVYLPPNYDKDTIDYPVLYFLDGQSLFDEKILEGHEWEIDEVIDSLARIGGQQAIVIGVYNADDRLTEYKPFLSPRLPEETSVSGDKHAKWIATKLKKWVDEKYRTKSDASSTVIGGASLGGLMSYYMICTYPEVYGAAIVFSPSFWVNEKVYTLDQQVANFSDKKIYINAGELETPTVRDAKKVYDILLARGMNVSNLKMDVEEDEGHWHMTWRKGFKKAFPWILER